MELRAPLLASATRVFLSLAVSTLPLLAADEKKGTESVPPLPKVKHLIDTHIHLYDTTPFLPHPIRSKGGFKALPPKAIS